MGRKALWQRLQQEMLLKAELALKLLFGRDIKTEHTKVTWKKAKEGRLLAVSMYGSIMEVREDAVQLPGQPRFFWKVASQDVGIGHWGYAKTEEDACRTAELTAWVTGREIL